MKRPNLFRKEEETSQLVQKRGRNVPTCLKEREKRPNLFRNEGETSQLVQKREREKLPDLWSNLGQIYLGGQKDRGFQIQRIFQISSNQTSQQTGSLEFPKKKFVHLVYRPVLPSTICMCTVQLALAGQMSARFLHTSAFSSQNRNGAQHPIAPPPLFTPLT